MGPDNKPHRPVLIHRAIFGTLERFTGVLIEHFAGAFPPWLAPVQVRIPPIADAHAQYDSIFNKLLKLPMKRWSTRATTIKAIRSPPSVRRRRTIHACKSSRPRNTPRSWTT